MSGKREFIINKSLSVKLNGQNTVIYVGGSPFSKCKSLLLNIPLNNIDRFSKIGSIDEVIQIIDIVNTNDDLSPQMEFWGHCSNLQVWAENNYDTRLIDSQLAFPLLKKLNELGDMKARKVFKEEIAKRLASGYLPVILYLKENRYFKYLSREELIYSLIKQDEANALLDLEQILGKTFEILFSFEEGKVGDFIIIKEQHIILFSVHKIRKIPKEIIRFKNLEELRIIGGELTKIPDYLSILDDLEYLFIPGHKISVIPKWMRDLKNLKSLDISYNPIKIIPKELSDLELLEEIDAEACPLKELPQVLEKITTYDHDIEIYFTP